MTDVQGPPKSLVIPEELADVIHLELDKLIMDLNTTNSKFFWTTNLTRIHEQQARDAVLLAVRRVMCIPEATQGDTIIHCGMYNRDARMKIPPCCESTGLRAVVNMLHPTRYSMYIGRDCDKEVDIGKNGVLVFTGEVGARYDIIAKNERMVMVNASNKVMSGKTRPLIKPRDYKRYTIIIDLTLKGENVTAIIADVKKRVVSDDKTVKDIRKAIESTIGASNVKGLGGRRLKKLIESGSGQLG